MLSSSCSVRKNVDKNVYRGFKTVGESYSILGIRYPEYCVKTTEYKNFPIDLCLGNICYDSYFGELRRYYDLYGPDVSLEMIDENETILFSKTVKKEELRKIDYAIPGSHNGRNYCFEDFNKKLTWTIDLLDFYPNEGKVEGGILFTYYSSYENAVLYRVPYTFEHIDNMLFFKIGIGGIVKSWYV